MFENARSLRLHLMKIEPSEIVLQNVKANSTYIAYKCLKFSLPFNFVERVTEKRRTEVLLNKSIYYRAMHFSANARS